MKTKFFPYTLSIALIVKNEAHRLRACLDGLAPLRNAISCELILTDLGSTDGTQEIAKEYADVFLEHEWCDDFSKARNTGVAAAKGRWFFYVDTDYQFDESILDIVSFLSDKKQSKIYNSATVTLENHVKNKAKKENKEIKEIKEDSEATTSSYYHTQRGLLVNFSGGKRFFKGMTHESIPTYGVAYPLKTRITRTIEEDTQEEQHQTILLLQEQLKKEPNDLKHYIELAEALQDPQQRQEVFQDGLSKSKTLSAKNKDNVLWTAILYSRYLLFLLKQEDWTAFDSLEKEWDNPFPQSIIDLNVQGIGLSFSLIMQNHEEVLRRFPSYQKLFYQLKKTPDQLFSMVESFHYAREPFFYHAESNAIRCAVALQIGDLSQQWLTQSDTYSFVHSNQTRAYLPNFCECAMVTEEFSLIRKAYDYLSVHGAPEDLTLLWDAVSPQYQNLSGYTQTHFEEIMSGLNLPFRENNSQENNTQETNGQEVPAPHEAPPPSTEHSAPTDPLPTLEQIKQNLLALLQQGEVSSATTLLATAQARFPEDPTLQALQETLGS